MAPKLKTRNQPTLPLLLSGSDINPGAKTPDMLPSGSEEPIIYFLGHSPDRQDDTAGEPFVGNTTALLRKHLPKWLNSKVRYNNAVRTLLSNESDFKRKVTEEELQLYRDSLYKDIEKTRPKVIIALGNVALQALIPSETDINLCRGRRFPVRFGLFDTWVCPINDASYIARIQNNSLGDIPGTEHKAQWLKDLAEAIKLSEELIDPIVIHKELLQENLITFPKYSKGLVKEIIEHINSFKDSAEVAFDFETNALRPYGDDSRIISMAIGNVEKAISFPLETKEKFWSNEEIAELHMAIREFLEYPNLKIAHNLNFELEWILYRYGKDLARTVSWGDTEAESFVIDERIGGHDLGFCTQLNFGTNIKLLSNVNTKKIDDEPLDKVLLYNALDAKGTFILHKFQYDIILDLKLKEVLDLQIERVPTLVLTQLKGILVDVELSKKFSSTLEGQINSIKENISKLPEVVTFSGDKKKEFNPNSNPQTVEIFRDYYKVPSPPKGKFSVDAESLKNIKNPLSELLLEFREIQKLKSTYVDSLRIGKLLWPDNKLHPIFNSTKTVTGRLSCKEPNAQNFPSRKNKYIRSQIIAGPGNKIVAVDFSQIESRCIAMASNDAYLMKATREGYDIHAEWATKLGKEYPKIAKARKYDLENPKDFKKFRSEIKNELVFPLFYGSQPNALAARLGISEAQAQQIYNDFWRAFPGVLKWQKSTVRGYRELGYIQMLTGRRRHGPMSLNMVCNAVIQGSASDLVVDSMTRLSKIAERDNKPWLQAILNIHDDLTFIIPDEHLESSLIIIINEMTNFSFYWVTLPIEVEASMGDNWGALQPIGKFETESV